MRKQLEKIALTQAETSLQKYKNQVEDTSKKIKLGTADLEDFANKLDKTGDKLTGAGKRCQYLVLDLELL